MKRVVYIKYEVKVKGVSTKSRAKSKEEITFYTFLYDVYNILHDIRYTLRYTL